jgi:hypothetical protein
MGATQVKVIPLCGLDLLAYSIAADTWQAFPEQDRTMYWRDEVKDVD